MPVVHVYVGEGVLDGGELVFAWAVFEGGPDEVTNEVAKRAVKRGDRWCVEKGHERLCEELRSDCDVFVLPEGGDGVRRELTDLAAMRPGDRVHVRSRRRARETYLRRCIPSPAGVPTSPYPKTPVASVFPSPVGSGDAADAASCPVWDAKAEDAVDKELSFECESPGGASVRGSSPPPPAEAAAGGYTDAWCAAWAACASSEELVRLLTPQCQLAVRALTLGDGDSHSLALTSATGFPDGGGGTGIGGEEASQLSLGFGDGPYNQLGAWESLVVPPDGRSPAPPAPPSTSCQTTGQSPAAAEYEDAEAAADAAAAAEQSAAADVTSDDALQSPMLEHVFMQVVHGQRSLSPDASQRITAKDLRKNRAARMQIEHAHRLSGSTAWASLSPERRRGLSRGGDEEDPSSPPRSQQQQQQQPASPVTRACDRVLSAERAGDEEESSRAYTRLLASLRHSKLKDLPPHKQQQLLQQQQQQQQQALLRSPPSSAASPDGGVRRKTRRQALCDAEPVARRNLQREESAAWVRVFKAARAARDVAASSARHKSWEAASARKRWCTRGQWRVIAGETSLRQMCILESLETWKPLASLLRTQEIEMVRRVAIFAGWEQEWRRLSVVLGDWRSTLDEETQRRVEEEEAVAAMEHPEGGLFTTEEARDGYLEELRLIEERKHVLGEQICQEEFREELQEEQDEWDNRQSAWFEDRERHRLEALYHPTAYGVLQQRRQIPYTGGDFTKARAQHYQTREPPTDRPRTLARGPRTPRSASKTTVQGAPPTSAATPAAATASPASQTWKTPRREDGNAGVWPFELHRRQLEDRLFGYS